MSRLEIAFETMVDTQGYRFVETTHPEMPGWVKGVFVPQGGFQQRIAPTKHHATLYQQFAQLDGSPEQFRTFIGQFGPVTYSPLQEHQGEDHEPDDDFEQLADVALYFNTIRDALDYWSKGTVPPLVVDLHMRLVATGMKGKAGLAFAPNCLGQAMILQLAQVIASGASIRQCENPRCATWFEIGAGVKRTSARFCSTTCRMQFHGARRYQGERK